MPRDAKMVPNTSTLALTTELTLHTFEQKTKACGSLTRRYLTYVPKQVGTAVPVLLALHGSGANAESMQSFMTRGRLDALAARDGFIVVYPNAAPGALSDSNPEFPNTGSWRQEFFDDEQVDDVGYLTEVVHDLKVRHVIDGNNPLYLVGISNGGGMVLKMARQRPNLFRGIASVMGYDGEPPAAVPDLRGTDLNRVLFIYSEADPGLPKNYLKYQSANPATWARALGLTDSVINHPKVTPLYDHVHEGENYLGSSRVALGTRDSHAVQYDMVAPGSPRRLRVIAFDHAGHFWPNPSGETADFAIQRWGFRNQDIDAADVVWEFFFGDVAQTRRATGSLHEPPDRKGDP